MHSRALKNKLFQIIRKINYTIHMSLYALITNIFGHLVTYINRLTISILHNLLKQLNRIMSC